MLCHYHACLTEETEAERGQDTCPESNRSKGDRTPTVAVPCGSDT